MKQLLNSDYLFRPSELHTVNLPSDVHYSQLHHNLLAYKPSGSPQKVEKSQGRLMCMVRRGWGRRKRIILVFADDRRPGDRLVKLDYAWLNQALKDRLKPKPVPPRSAESGRFIAVSAGQSLQAAV